MASSLACSRASRPNLCSVVAIHPLAAGFRPAAAVLALALAFALQPRPVGAQPAPAQVVHGSASFARDGSNLLVTTGNGAGTNHSAINWSSFSVPAGSVTQFVQPTATSTSINRVIEASPSQIFGRLSSNGRLVLVNPWGIAIGAGAQIDTAGFTASTLAMSEADAIAGRLRFAGGGSALKVDGTIRAQGGDVVLIAPKLETGASAVVQADGATMLAAGQEVEITGRGLEGILMRVQAGSEAVNLGTLQGDAVGIFAATLKHSGLVQAQAVSVEGGKVVLKATGDALVDGTILATQGDKGGSVDVFGDRVGLLAGASIDASGAAGGGSVRIGGDYQGFNADAPNARKAYVDEKATIAADATRQGDGGRVIVWSDDMTRMRGRISARGGTQGGDGGFAEVSGKRFLDFTGRVDLRAPAGQAGRLLLDPNDIEISGSRATDTASTGAVFEGGSDTAYVNAQDLSAQLQLSDTEVRTSGNAGTNAIGHITLASDATVQWSSGNALTLHADNGITLAGQVNASGDGGPGGTLHLYAVNGSIEQTGGSLRVGKLLAWANNGSVLLDQPNHVSTLAGYSADNASQFVFRNAENLTIGSVTAPLGSGSGVNPDWNHLGATTLHTDAGLLILRTEIGGSRVTLDAPGNVEVQGYNGVEARNGALAVHAGGDVNVATESGSYTTSLSGTAGVSITAEGAVRMSSTWPGDGAPLFGHASVQSGGIQSTGVTITANGGNVDFGPSTQIWTSHSPVVVSSVPGSILGSVGISTSGTANGSITLDAVNGSASFLTLSSSGSDSSPTAGAVSVTAKGDVHGTGIYTLGYTHSSVDPGDGGAVLVNSTDGNIVLDLVSTQGGIGATGAGQSGKGGDITLSALGTAAGSGNIIVSGSLTAKGGAAESGVAGPDPLRGGAGGTIRLEAGRDIALGVVNGTSSIDVSGGAGYSGVICAPAGVGGSVVLSSLAGSILQAGQVDVLANGGAAALPVYGTGKGGKITIGAPAGLVMLGALQAHGGGSEPNDAGSATVTAGGGVKLGAVDLSGGPGTFIQEGGGPGGVLVVTAGSGNASLAGVDTSGRWGGNVTLSSSGGNVAVDGIAANGRTGSGGNVALSALSAGDTGGFISVGASGILNYGSLASLGGGGSGGSVTLLASRGIEVGGPIAAHAQTSIWPLPGAGGVGGTVLLDSLSGDVRAGRISTSGSGGGALTIHAHQGNIVLTGASANSGGASKAGPITLQASGTGEAGGSITVSDQLSSQGFAYSMSQWRISSEGGTILLHADKTVTVPGGISVGGGGKGGTIDVTSDSGNIVLGALSARGGSGGWTGGGAGGTVVLKALGTGSGAGTIQVGGESGVRVDGGATGLGSRGGSGGDGGSFTAQAGTLLLVTGVQAQGGAGSTWTWGSARSGGSGGSVTLSAGQGNVSVRDIVNIAGGTGANGGELRRGHGGSLDVNSAGSVSIGQVNADGGSGVRVGDAGGDAGTVVISALADIQLAEGGWSANGGVGLGAPGGAGATVRLTSTTGSVSIPGPLSALGGDGAQGGKGGDITVTALGTAEAGGRITIAGSVTATGGATEGPPLLQGGAGGTIRLEARRDIALGHVESTSGIDASGGAGTDYTEVSSVPGGMGGAIVLSSLAGSILQAGQVDVLANGGGGLPFNDTGKGGTITISAPAGSVMLGGLQARGGGFGPHDGGSATVTAGGGINLGAVDLSGGAGTPFVLPGTPPTGARDGFGGSLVVTAGSGSASLSGINTSGRSGGNVTVSSSGGDVAVDGIQTSGRSANGGNVALSALSAGDTGGFISIGASGILSSGSREFRIEGPAPGGSVTLLASRGIEVSGAISAYGAPDRLDPSVYDAGGTVLLDSLAGDVRAGGIGTSGAVGGALTINAHQGNIFLSSADADSTGASKGGTILLHAANTVSVAGGMSVLVAYSGGGQGGTIDVTSDNGNIVLGALSANGASGGATGGGAGGTVVLKALGTGRGAGTIQVGGESGVRLDGGASVFGGAGDGGSFTAEAGTLLLVTGVRARGGAGGSPRLWIPGGSGGSGGSVTLSAGGAVHVRDIVDIAGGTGANGGELRRGHGGRLDVNSGGSVSIGGVYADGGSGVRALPGDAAGDAGTVVISALSDIQLGELGWSAKGGVGLGAPGGAGGTVRLTSTTGSVNMPGLLFALGGAGAPGGKGGSVEIHAGADIGVPAIAVTGGAGLPIVGGAQGGGGGSVLLRFAAGSQADSIEASGGVGAPGSLDGPNGGAGGKGGSIAVGYVGTGTLAVEGVTFTARGGTGGSAYRGSTGVGGVGGDGGSISISSTGALVVRADPVTLARSTADAGPGAGGWNADESAQAARGALGFTSLSAAGDLTIEDPVYDPATNLSALAGGALVLNIPITTDGGAVSLQGTSVSLTQPIATTGATPSAVAAAAPSIAATTATPGADVTITADQLDLQTTVNAGAARATVHPLTSTRLTRLGGADDSATLQLSQDEINRITAGTLAIGDALQSGGVAISGAITIDPALAPVLALVSQGEIAQDPATSLAANALRAAGGSVMLDNVTASTVSGSAATGAFQLTSHATGPLAIGTVDGSSGISAAGPVTIATAGPLHLLDAIGSSASGNAVVLAAPNLFVASTASIAAPAGRWLVYLDTPDGNDFGTLTSGNYALWGHTFTANPPGSITQAGNRYLFAIQPALDVAADPKSKVYDGTPDFSLTYQPTGFVDAAPYQNAFLQDDAGTFTGALALANPSKNVGSYAITQGTLASTYAIRFTGSTATITQAPLAVNGMAASKVYDATTDATIGTSASLIGLVAGDDVVFKGATGTYDNKNVGTGKAVTVSSAALSGTDLGNYTVTLGPVSGTIAPAPLTINAHNLGKQEGQALVFAGTEFTPAKTGIGDETITFVSLTSAGAPADAKAGVYAIKASGATGSNGFVAGNYAITYLDGALAVVPSLFAQVRPAAVYMNNQVVTFATLFVEQAHMQPRWQTTMQDLEDAKKKDEGREDIVITDTACKPS